MSQSKLLMTPVAILTQVLNNVICLAQSQTAVKGRECKQTTLRYFSHI